MVEGFIHRLIDREYMSLCFHKHVVCADAYLKAGSAGFPVLLDLIPPRAKKPTECILLAMVNLIYAAVQTYVMHVSYLIWYTQLRMHGATMHSPRVRGNLIISVSCPANQVQTSFK